MPCYHFNFGNSSEGPIGFCAAVRASNPNEALERLKGRLPDEMTVVPWRRRGDVDGVEYIEVYFKPAAIVLEDIDEVQHSNCDDVRQ